MSDVKKSALGDITRAVMNLMDAWGLETREMQALLALPGSARARVFNKYREGHAEFPDSPEVLRRAHYVIRIGDALRTTYPLNPRMGERWIRQPHRRFGRRTPLSIILNDGELEDAQWFTREQLRSDFPKLPFRISIARRLVDHWILLGEDD